MQVGGLQRALKRRSRTKCSTWSVVAVSLVWLFMHAPAQAQTVVDGSDQGLLRGELPLLLSVLKRGLTRSDGRGNPQSAQVRNIVQVKPGVYCGEVSTRGRNGQYGPFTRFVVETKIRQATIEPVDDLERLSMMLRMIEDRCRSLGGDSR
jgi:hypothetical protein